LKGADALDESQKAVKWTETQLELANGSRIVCLPGQEETVRSFQGVSLLVKDEAARIPDELNKSVTPMIAISKGQEVDLSTPWGQRGRYYRRWNDLDRKEIKRFKVTWKQCPRHNAAFIAQEVREHGQEWVNQEYEVMFTAMSGLVFPTFRDCLWEFHPIATLPFRKVGGIDFGFRNPFAAVWGTLNGDGSLAITN